MPAIFLKQVSRALAGVELESKLFIRHLKRQIWERCGAWDPFKEDFLAEVLPSLAAVGATGPVAEVVEQTKLLPRDTTPTPRRTEYCEDLKALW